MQLMIPPTPVLNVTACDASVRMNILEQGKYFAEHGIGDGGL